MRPTTVEVAAAALVACAMFACPSPSRANTVELSVNLDADQGLSFTFGFDWFFQTALASFDPVTLSNGDTLIVNFAFVGAKGLQITNTQGGDQIEFQFFGPIATGSVEASSQLDFLQYAGAPTDTTFFDSGFSAGNFIPCICNANVTDSQYTLFAGRLTTTIVSGMDTPFDFNQLRIQVSSGQEVQVVSSVPIPAAAWLLLSGLAALGTRRREARLH